MSCLDNARQLQQMMGQGQTMEAFEKFYHDNVKVTEMATGEVRQGKDTQREAIKGWQASIKEWHGGGSGPVTSNEDKQTTMVESWFDATFQDGNRMKMEEVAVQKWKDGQIVEERFYYNVPGA